MDEMHLLLREDQTSAYTVEIWKRFRKWGGIPTGITQNVKDLLASKEVENIFENSDFIYMLNQAVGDRQILAKQLNISPHQLSYVTHSGEGEGLLFYGNVILPFVDRFPTNTELYRIMTLEGAQVIFTPASFTMATGKEHWECILRTRAIENACYIVAADQIGQKHEFLAYGHSMVIDPWGTIIAKAKDEAGMFYADIDLDYEDKIRQKVPVLKNRRSDIYEVKRR